MEHTPNSSEQEVIDEILTRYRTELVPVRLTTTMLSKAIIDARGPLRAYLAATGLVEFGAIGQGPTNKVQLLIPFVSRDGAEDRMVSFYRPTTKHGDPRIWVERLASVAQPGDLLVFAFSEERVAVVLVNGSPSRTCELLQPLLKSQFELRGRLEQTVRDLTRLLSPMRGEWIPTMRAGPTGVGYTLETKLNLAANVRQGPDFPGLELKSFRRGAVSGAGKLVTLFAKTPRWMHADKDAGLLRRCGYYDEQRWRRALYCTITVKKNTLDLYLDPLPDEKRIRVLHSGDAIADYAHATLKKRLEEKHPATLFVIASCRGKGAREEFRYEHITLCERPSFANFLDLVDEEALGLDLTLSEKPKGGIRNHGYLWRIREYRIPDLFAYRKVLTQWT